MIGRPNSAEQLTALKHLCAKLTSECAKKRTIAVDNLSAASVQRVASTSRGLRQRVRSNRDPSSGNKKLVCWNPLAAPTSTSSSPVDMMATLGSRKTSTQLKPRAARTWSQRFVKDPETPDDGR